MSRNTWQQVVAISLVFLFLGPTAMSVLHEHASESIEQCTGGEESHFHTFADSPACFICGFSFSTFQVEELSDPEQYYFPQLLVRPNLIQKEFHLLLIPFDHAPRGPPVFSSVLG
ncbi:MAG: hypothetical protein R2824_24775 [Saprospiraceae bacterium]|nr:hypothetical protein [Lewinella sp.]